MKKFNILPGEERALKLNDAQIMYAYYNILEDEREKEDQIRNVLNYLSFFINPKLFKDFNKSKDKNTGSTHSTDDDVFYDRIAAEMRKNGRTEEEIDNYINGMKGRDSFGL